MKKENFSILFVVVLRKLNQKGLCPINIRITYKGQRKENATGYFVEPEYWNAKQQKVLISNQNSRSLNAQIELIYQKLNNAYLSLSLENEHFEVEDIYSKYIGKPQKISVQVIDYFNQYLDKIYRLVGKDIQLATWKKYNYASKQITSFVKWKYKKSDYPLDKITLNFLLEFEYFLRAEQNQSQTTINKAIQRFRKIISVAISEGVLDKDPFIQFHPKRIKKEIVFLTSEELSQIEKTLLTQKRLQFVNDLFIFCCYTGLAYNEMFHLEKQHIQLGFDGNNWIQMKREKTQRQVSIPILPKAQEIIDKYRTEGNRIFPSISNQKFNSYLKEIADIVGIEKRLTHHIARKTFASTVLLYNDVPMEIVSELLGHSSMVITQESYGKVVQKKISEEMKKLNFKLSKISR